jgi:CRISPR-associated protein Cmr1
VLVRGLGGTACDPTRTECRDKNHCVVCELFGCTGWARKFRFQVLDADGKPQKCQIKADQKFQLSFTPLRPVTNEEWALLDMTLRLIADYGAIGGRTVLKPSDDESRADQEHHRDYGLIQILRKKSPVKAVDRKKLEHYVRLSRWQKVCPGGFAWASLENFWCVKGRYLARQDQNTSTFNRVTGLPEPKGQSSQKDSWLAGYRAQKQPKSQDPESKKVFSFKEPEGARRTYGFVKPEMVTCEEMVTYEEIKQRLKQAWPDLGESEFQTGGAILNKLF